MRAPSLIAGAILIAIGLLVYLNSPPPHMQKETLTIKRGDSLKSVSIRLKRLNLIRSEQFITLYGILTFNTNIKRGKYIIPRGISSAAILKKLVAGDTVRRQVTIPEGFNLYQTGERLAARGITDYRSFISCTSEKSTLRSMGITAPSAEGYLFPDTYIFSEETDAREIITVMVKRLRTVLKRVDRSPLKRLGLNIHQLLTIASLIEKEARKPEERSSIAAVFYNRLRKGMKLDCDPTVRYAVKKFTGAITVSDLENRSPYNTYVHSGLPPTPICSPGLASIRAALHPAEEDYLYFVSRNDGSHYFSRKLSEHLRAVAFYQKGIANGFIDRQKKR